MLTGHCKPFSASCKEGFQNFFEKFQEKAQRREQRPQNPPQQAEKRPEYAQHKRAERQKIQNSGQKYSEEHIQPELSLPRIERKAEQGQKQQQQKQPPAFF